MTAASYLLDTDWVIDHFNRVEAVTRRLRELQPRGLALSIISVAELWEGVHFSKGPERSQAILEEFLSGVVVLGLDEEICKRFGQLRGLLRQQGKLVGDFDLLIAASALRHNLSLLSNNRRHFENIEGLRLESISR
ncbi:MAG: type II toxin-antitoxin system VapC family toxin [Acidobacteria bacterium]|nr:type II toxin-antitoxin system VapC family toxin [Acidobacteriota bacterium]